jgi:hypothetical protein
MVKLESSYNTRHTELLSGTTNHGAIKDVNLSYFTNPIYLHAKSLFDTKEFQRCAKFLEKYTETQKDNVFKFLYFYSLFLDGEKKKQFELPDLLGKTISFK